MAAHRAEDPALFTLPIGLLYLKGQSTPDYSASMALALISVVPMVLLFLLFQRYFVQGFARSGIRRAQRYQFRIGNNVPQKGDVWRMVSASAPQSVPAGVPKT